MHAVLSRGHRIGNVVDVVVVVGATLAARHASASTIRSAQFFTAAEQSPCCSALAHLVENFEKHFASFVTSIGTPLFAAFESTLARQKTFFPNSLSLPASHFDCAHAGALAEMIAIVATSATANVRCMFTVIPLWKNSSL